MKARSAQQGFTLAELMAVVAIIAILATLSVYGVTNYIKVSRTAEVGAVVNSIRGAQEAYREETFAYLDVSTDFDDLYPAAPSGRDKHAWGDTSSATGGRWATLGVQTSGPVMFGYACVAGPPNTNPEAPDASMAGKTFNWSTTASAEPWYVILAVGDQDADGTYSAFVSSSFTDDLYRYRQTE